MKKKISSDTVFLRGLPAIGFLIALIIVLFVSDLDIRGKTAYSIAFLVGMFMFLGSFLELKDVEIDEHYMYVSDRRGTVRIPFSMIKSVRDSFFGIQKNVVIVELKIETRFGSTIKFAPYDFFWWFLLQHPVIGELKRLTKLHENS